MSNVDIKQLLKEARLPEREVAVCLRGDLAAEHERLVRQYSDDALKSQDSFAGTGRREIVEQAEAIREQMLQHEVTFRFRAQSRRRWSELERENPPRDGDKDDARVGFNRDQVVTLAMRESIVDPQLDADDWQKLDDTLTEAQYTQIANAVWLLNMDPISVPFSLAALLKAQNSEAE